MNAMRAIIRRYLTLASVWGLASLATSYHAETRKYDTRWASVLPLFGLQLKHLAFDAASDLLLCICRIDCWSWRTGLSVVGTAVRYDHLSSGQVHLLVLFFEVGIILV